MKGYDRQEKFINEKESKLTKLIGIEKILQGICWSVLLSVDHSIAHIK